MSELDKLALVLVCLTLWVGALTFVVGLMICLGWRR